MVDLDKKMVSLHGTWMLTRSADGSRIAEVKPSKKSEWLAAAADRGGWLAGWLLLTGLGGWLLAPWGVRGTLQPRGQAQHEK